MAVMDIGIDLGTASILVYIKGKGVVLKEPSVVAQNMDTKQIMAIGEDARLMLGRTPGNIVTIRPIRDGDISDYDTTEIMLQYFLNKAIGKKSFRKPRVAVCVPSQVSPVQKKAVEDAAYQVGAGKVAIIEEPLAAAIGAGIDISKPQGNMIVDIGGGSTDVAVISLNGVVCSQSIKIAGDRFDKDIQDYVKSKYNVIIGDRTAEDVKINIGTAYHRDEIDYMDIHGLNIVKTLPETIRISSEETQEALKDSTKQILDTICEVLEHTPPELAGDIIERGIVLTGGGAMLRGLEELIEERTHINTMTADEPMTCVAIGTGRYIEFLAKYNKDM
ncbi:MAG: rod shape-determining protein [Lachnospiraceae bacterium]|nr:rod shape-determining protein [Lachnospiraceae bacterium]